MAKEMLEYDVFDGGLNTKAEPVNILPGQSPYLDDIVFGDYGSIMSRGGISTHNSVAMSYYGPQGFASYSPSTMSAQMMVIASGSLYVMTGAATTPVLISGSTDLWDINHPVEMEQMSEKMFIASTLQNLRKFNGSNLTQAGVYAPTQALTAACDAAGSMTGTYKYVYWGVNSYAAEGDYIATPSTAVTIASGYVRVNNIPTAPASHGINFWKVGRNTAGADGIYWYLTDVTNGVTSFTDVASDETLEVLAPTDQGYPRQFQNMCVYGGRLWGSVGDILWYSNVNQPEEFPSTNFIRVGSGTGGNISAIKPFMGSIIISMSGWNPEKYSDQSYSEKSELYALRIGDSVSFNDPENWYLNLVVPGYGSESHRSCIQVAGMLLLVARGGVSLFNGSSIANSIQETSVGGTLSTRISDQISSIFDGFDIPSDIRVACAIEWKGRVYISIPESRPTSYTRPRNTMTLVYDYTRVGKGDPAMGAWSRYMLSSASKFVIHDGELYGADAAGLTPIGNAGYIFKWDNGNGYDRTTPNNINPEYRLAPIRGKKEHFYNQKDFRFIKIWASGTGTIYAVIRINGNGGLFSDVGGSAIGSYGFPLSSTVTEIKLTLPPTASGKHLWISFTVLPTSPATTCDMTVNRVQVFYNLRGLRNT